MKIIKSMQYTLYSTTYEVLETLHHFKIDIYYNWFHIDIKLRTIFY